MDELNNGNFILEYYASRADEIQPEDALNKLADIYIECCGISLGFRTLAFECSSFWIEKLKAKDPEKYKDIEILHDFMKDYSVEYKKDKENIDKYDITFMDHEAFKNCCLAVIDEIEEIEGEEGKDYLSYKIVLAAGTKHYLQ